MDQIIELKGRVPSKKNSRRLIIRGHRTFSLPSESYEAWHDEQILILRARGTKPVEGPVELYVSIWAPDDRQFDGDNSLTSIMDLLKDAGVIKDDDRKIVPKGTFEYMGIDRQNPRVEILVRRRTPQHRGPSSLQS